MCSSDLLIFEFGKGASEHYGASPNLMFELFASLGYSIYTLAGYLQSKQPISLDSWREHYENGTEYYFVADVTKSKN